MPPTHRALPRGSRLNEYRGALVLLPDEQHWSRELLRLVAERSAAETELTERHRREIADEERGYAEVVEQITAAYDAEAADLAARLTSIRDAATERWNAAWNARETAVRNALADIDHRYQSELDAARQKRDESHWLIGSVLDESSAESPLQQLQRLRSQVEGTHSHLESTVAEVDRLREAALAHLVRCRMSTDAPPLDAPSLVDDLQQLAETCLDAARQVERPARALRQAWLPRLFSGFWPMAAWVLLSAALAGPTWIFVEPRLLGIESTRTEQGWILTVAASGAGVAIVLLVLLHVFANQAVSGRLLELLTQSRRAHAAFTRWQRLARHKLADAEDDYEQRHQLRAQRRNEALARAEDEYARVSTEMTARRDAELFDCQTRVQAERQQAEAVRRHELQQLERAEQAAWTDFQQRRARDLEQLVVEHTQRLNDFAVQHRQEWDAVCSRWEHGLRELTAMASGWEDAARRRDFDWEQCLAALPPFDGDQAVVPFGWLSVGLDDLPNGRPTSPQLTTAVDAWSLPLTLDVARQPGLLIRAETPAGRRAAVQLLQSVMLRLLVLLPPGRVRFTILDPVGLGENFSSFMHLADTDELLVTSRIWTEPDQIEQRLADLTEHMETVLQMFLRNEFATLADYNRQAGEVAEPYRVLVAANVPVNTTDVALRRLWNIVMGGARCGVIPLISVDTSQPWPRGFSLADLESRCVTVEWNSSPTRERGDLSSDQDSLARASGYCGFRIAAESLQQWPLSCAAPPANGLFGELVKQAGRRAGDVRRVEVPFWRVAPADDAVWTRNSARGLDVPIGRAGATKTQSVQLGSGTSQHVLVAGKTGSGKSTLLHALITNAALFYSPDQLELYLVDFKKGVEFKVYSRWQLPHARVIAMESDREFGVSVLERLDALLQERSALFRNAGVADLPGYRQARPAEPLPRVLLIVDEFQEFFVEDDQLAQSASLLLDRLVRQGRAFGVHVVLGSQTLAGAYSLARSTLGQVAVRIALQCSETDAHLILSEDNTAARLLTRPGEAIYNDANGLPSGNQLFQVVWLSDDERERRLTALQCRGGELARPPAIVFEGHAPVELDRLPVFGGSGGRTWRSADDHSTFEFRPPTSDLRSPATHAPSSSNGIVPVWLGEAVSLSGPMRLEFLTSPGSNLLVVGQDEAAALGVLAASVISVAAGVLAPRESRGGDAGNGAESSSPPGGSPEAKTRRPITILNGSPQERTAVCWREVAAALPGVALGGHEMLDGSLKELVDEVRRRDGQPGPRRWLCLFDLVRFRKLRRKDDDFGFGSLDKSGGASPGELLAELLRDGPPVGVHVWAWCDSANTVQRWLSREMQHQFEQRVVFAMNANDSSQLIDSPVASRLGPHRAWLFCGDRGTLEKFRPYQPPEGGWLQERLRESATSLPR